MSFRTVHDPFTGQDVQISDKLVDRLRGKYASGPHLPNGKPEFGWRQFQAPPIQHEAAARIEVLEAEYAEMIRHFSHYHVKGDGDVCKQCGLDLRHDVHIRLTETPNGRR